jgi:FdhD protein
VFTAGKSLPERPICPGLNTEKKPILRWVSGTPPEQEWDAVAIEEPLEIQIETRPISVTMRTPGHDEELAAGFLLSEGLITERDAISKIVPYPRNPAGNAISFFLKPEIQVDFASLTRHVFASSSCGLCGTATIAAVHKRFAPVTKEFTVSRDVIQSLPARLRAQQKGFEASGGLHAAGLFSTAGDPIVIREDVGRHNAVDKVLGHALLTGRLPLRETLLVVSGRASFEIAQKALAGRIAVIVAVSAPSSLAVEFADKSGQTLVGFAREERLNIYAHPERIRFG